MSRHYLVDYGLPLALALAGIALRVPFTRNFPGEWDEVDFVLAVSDYNIILEQPHFPGYPVFIWGGQILNLITHDAVKALTLSSAVLGGLTALPLYCLARDMYSRKAAVLAACLFIVNPLCWLMSERAMSDTAGLFFLLLSVFVLHRARLFPDNTAIYLPLGTALMGVTLGVRLSYFPFLALLGYIFVRHFGEYGARRVCIRTLCAFVLGTLFWVVPLANSVAGLDRLSSQAVVFAGGHFADWGGSIVTSPDLLCRLERVLWCLFCCGLGVWWRDASYMSLIPTTIFFAGLVVSLRIPSQEPRTGLIFAVFLPYALWVFFAQNVEKPRHMLPLIPFMLVFISAGILNISSNRRIAVVLAVLAIAATCINSMRLAAAQERTRPPSLQLIDYVKCNFDRLSTRVYCGESKRLFGYYATGWDVRMARNVEGLKYDVAASLCPPEVILATSGVGGVPERGTVLHRFRGDAYIFSPYHELVLYKINAEDL